MQTAENRTRYLGSFAVAPLAGAWIEIQCGVIGNIYHCESLPSRERGLKLLLQEKYGNIILVAPLAGAWIEIALYSAAF